MKQSYALERDVWHITLHERGDTGHSKRLVGMCLHLFTASRVKEARPPENQICCGCLHAEKQRAKQQAIIEEAKT